MKRILIANRGEIAIRISRAARELGLIPLGIASEADRHALHRRAMAESRIIGPAPARESYLDIARVVAAAQAMNADAVHPGYGFLSERADFAQAVLDAGLLFIGPTPATLHAAGDKRVARRLAAEAGIPTLLGYDGDDQSLATLLREAVVIGFPILIKASNGGGGRGQRVVHEIAEFAEALTAAKREALAAFGDESVLLERYVSQPRHIEFQIIADHFGAVAVLGERDCSLQRRRQKVIEEAPAFGLTPELRSAMADAALRIARATSYRSLGTVEFLVDGKGAFYFLEINARLQVEHPVTEMVTGFDLVQAQFRVARGESLPPEFAAVQARGHAVEARICAEDPARDLLPASGTIRTYRFPNGPHIRVDSGYAAGFDVPLEYDSLLGKLIVWGRDRSAALEALDNALEQAEITGIATNIPLLRRLCRHQAVREGRVHTTLIDDGGFLQASYAPAPLADETLALALSAYIGADGAWRMVDVGRFVHLEVDGQAVQMRASRTANGWLFENIGSWVGAGEPPPPGPALETVFEAGNRGLDETHISVTFARVGQATAERSAVVRRAGNALFVTPDGTQSRISIVPTPAPSTNQTFRPRNEAAALAMQRTLRAPMPGRVLKLLVTTGETVTDRQLLAILEAMKMEHRIEASGPGTIGTIYVREGSVVTADAQLLELLPPSSGVTEAAKVDI